MKQILLYGTSIFLAGLATQLQGTPGLRVRQQANLSGLVDLGNLDAVVVDLNDAAYADVLALVRARPDIKIVGINANSSAVTVLSGRVYLAQDMDDLVGWLALPEAKVDIPEDMARDENRRSGDRPVAPTGATFGIAKDIATTKEAQ